jgi:hypothetical protein
MFIRNEPLTSSRYRRVSIPKFKDGLAKVARMIVALVVRKYAIILFVK